MLPKVFNLLAKRSVCKKDLIVRNNILLMTKASAKPWTLSTITLWCINDNIQTIPSHLKGKVKYTYISAFFSYVTHFLLTNMNNMLLSTVEKVVFISRDSTRSYLSDWPILSSDVIERASAYSSPLVTCSERESRFSSSSVKTITATALKPQYNNSSYMYMYTLIGHIIQHRHKTVQSLIKAMHNTCIKPLNVGSIINKYISDKSSQIFVFIYISSEFKIYYSFNMEV